MHDLGKGKWDTGVTFGENNSNWATLPHLRGGKFCNVAEFEKGEAMGNENEQAVVHLSKELQEWLREQLTARGISVGSMIVLDPLKGLLYICQFCPSWGADYGQKERRPRRRRKAVVIRVANTFDIVFAALALLCTFLAITIFCGVILPKTG